MIKYEEYKRLLGELDGYTSKTLNDHALVFDGMNFFIRMFSIGMTEAREKNHHPSENSQQFLFKFLLSFAKTIRDFEPTRVIVCFDGEKGNNRRKKMYENYKAKRNRFSNFVGDFTYEELRPLIENSLERVVNYLRALPVTIFYKSDAEADDLIAYIAQQSDILKKVTIVSTDRDFLQLVDERIEIYSPVLKVVFDIDRAYGYREILPCNIPLYRSFIGDVSDNIYGVRGIGEKTIKQLAPYLKTTPTSPQELIDRMKVLADDGVKKAQLIYENRDVVFKNYELMQLFEPMISPSDALDMRTSLQSLNPKGSYELFQSMWYEDNIHEISNIVLPEWYKRSFMKLSTYSF